MTNKTAKRLQRYEHRPATVAERFAAPFELDRMTGLMGATDDVCRLMPAMADIPEEFRRNYDNSFVRLQARWFHTGFGRGELRARPGIDHAKALRHLEAIQRSFEPAHEHKQAAVAYLMSLWFEEPKL